MAVQNIRQFRLTENDIRLLKYFRKLWIGFSIAIFFILISIGIFVLIFLDKRTELGTILPLLFILSFILSFLFYLFTGRKLNSDLRRGIKEIRIETLTGKGDQMKAEDYINNKDKFHYRNSPVGPYIETGGNRYIVDSKLYNAVDPGDTIEMHFAPVSKTVLGFIPIPKMEY